MALSTPKKRAKRREYNTPKRVQFFYAFDHKENSEGVGTVAHLPEITIPTSTARLWLKQREKLSSKALKSQRRSSSILGRPPKVSELDLCHITDQNDPIHEKGWETQAKSLPKQPALRTLQRYANQAGAKRFKKPYQTKISKKNQSLRSIYGQKHENKTITRFWSQIWFTDEAHFQSIKLSQAPEYELRFPGQKRAINEVSSAGLDVTIHVAAGISYNHKGALIFYRDPAEPSEKPQKPRKPKQLKYEIDSVFQARVKVYEDLQAKEAITPKGNCMTQAFYAEKILPKHIEEIKTLEARHKIQYYLQEDNDPSHGNRSQNNPAARLKRASDLNILTHPPQSPDLNPIEARWNIIKSRLRRKSWTTVAQFKADIQAEWDRITVAQVRRRIREMPERCKLVQAHPEIRIKSNLW